MSLGALAPIIEPWPWLYGLGGIDNRTLTNPPMFSYERRTIVPPKRPKSLKDVRRQLARRKRKGSRS
jgi:hypothetical protein